MMLRNLFSGVAAAAVLLTASCTPKTGGSGQDSIHNSVSPPTADFSGLEIVDWMELLYYHVANEKISPPQAARIYAYAGVIMYEAVLPGMPEFQTLSGQLNEMPELPRPDPKLEYDWLTVFHESMYQGFNFLLERNITGEVETLDDMVDAKLAERREAGVSEEIMARSQEYGKTLALAVEEWAKTDRFDKTRLPSNTYKSPSREGKPELWAPTDFGQIPLEPLWGTLRPFAMAEGKTCGINYPPSEGPVASTLPPFSTDPESDFYKAVKAVYDKDQNVTEDERIIALYWADDPGETSTPPGHWVYIMNNMVRSRGMKMDEAVEMYALTSMAMADAVISVWYTKFQVNMVRPKTYVREFMGDPDWEPWVETPPFPEYASGHSGFSAAAATVLTDLLGDQPFVDSTHVIIGLPPRAYDNFWAAAREAAESRHYGGIHYRAGIEDALGQGKCAGETVLSKVRTRIPKEETAAN